jgi:hypothetical protein
MRKKLYSAQIEKNKPGLLHLMMFLQTGLVTSLKNCTLLRLKKKQARVATSNDVPPNWLGNITEKLYSAQIEPKNITRKLRSAQIESKNITENYGLVRLKKKHH